MRNSYTPLIEVTLITGPNRNIVVTVSGEFAEVANYLNDLGWRKKVSGARWLPAPDPQEVPEDTRLYPFRNLGRN